MIRSPPVDIQREISCADLPAAGRLADGPLALVGGAVRGGNVTAARTQLCHLVDGRVGTGEPTARDAGRLVGRRLMDIPASCGRLGAVPCRSVSDRRWICREVTGRETLEDASDGRRLTG